MNWTFQETTNRWKQIEPEETGEHRNYIFLLLINNLSFNAEPLM